MCINRLMVAAKKLIYYKITVNYLANGKILEGKGIARSHIILVSGGPRSGKTTFAIQFLFTGATQYNEPGVYVTLDEDSMDIKANMLKYGWGLNKLEDDKKLVFINVSPVRVTSERVEGLIQIGMKEFRLVKLLEAIRKGVKDVKAKRIVVDPITIFMLQYPNEIERIYAMRDLMRDFKKMDCTILLISELR